MASTVADLQKIGVTLSETEISVEPGETVQLVVTMTNRQELPDRLLIEVEGVDVEWYFIPVSAVNVAAGASAGERVLFRIQRISENRAGSYPFLVRVQAMETGEVGVAQATLILKPYASVQVELNPRSGVSTFLHPLNEFGVTVSNQGNREETLELFAHDTDDECTYEFDMERVTLKPGQSEAVPLAMRPKSIPLLGSVSLASFTVTARATSDAYIVGKAQGQLEKRALISPLLGIFLLLLSFGSAAAYFFWPRPPVPVRIEEFTVSQNQIKAGGKVTLNWSVDGDFRQILIRTKAGKDGVAMNMPGEQTDASGKPRANGTLEVTPAIPTVPSMRSMTTTYILQVRGKGNQPLQERKVEVTVAAPPASPAPKIVGFQVEPRVIHMGEMVMLTWKSTGAKTTIIDPGDQKMSEYAQSFQTAPTADTTYILRVIGENPKDKPAEASVKVRVVSSEACIAEITGFKAVTNPVYIGEPFKLRWQTQYARTVKIESTIIAPVEVATPRGGTYEFSIPETASLPVTFKLTATDSANKSVEKTITIMPKQRPAPPPTETPTDGTTTNPTDGTTNSPTGTTP